MEKEQRTSTTTAFTSYRLHRLLSFFLPNVFHLFSLSLLFFSHSWKKNSFPTFFPLCYDFETIHFYHLYSVQHRWEWYMRINNKNKSLLLSTKIITCGRYSIAIYSNYLSCLCKTCTHANEETRSIKIIIMALSSACVLSICMCTKQS
jgi:hypothetical protein